MIAASLMLGVVHLFVWQKQRSQYANLLFFVLAVSAAAYGAYELARMQAETPADLATNARWSHVPLAVFVISVVGFVRLYFNAGRIWLAYGGDRGSAGRPRAEFPDRRQREFSGDYGAGSSAALGRRRRLRAHRNPESVGDRPPAQQPAARRVHRRCLHHPVAQGWARGAPPRGPRRGQSCTLHHRRPPASPHWSSPEWCTRPPSSCPASSSSYWRWATSWSGTSPPRRSLRRSSAQASSASVRSSKRFRARFFWSMAKGGSRWRMRRPRPCSATSVQNSSRSRSKC